MIPSVQLSNYTFKKNKDPKTLDCGYIQFIWFQLKYVEEYILFSNTDICQLNFVYEKPNKKML